MHHLNAIREVSNHIMDWAILITFKKSISRLLNIISKRFNEKTAVMKYICRLETVLSGCNNLRLPFSITPSVFR
jgi:hypothetical protein